MVNKELCKLCGKPKKEHYFGNGGYWCNIDIVDGKIFTPKKSNDSQQSNSGSIPEVTQNGKLSSTEETAADTLLQIEQRIRKGCRNDTFEEGILVPFKCGRKLRYGETDLCPTCQAQLNLIEEIKGMIDNIPRDVGVRFGEECISLKRLLGGGETR